MTSLGACQCSEIPLVPVPTPTLVCGFSPCSCPKNPSVFIFYPGFSSWNPSASKLCSRCAEEKACWNFDWCVFRAVCMLALCPFSCLPLTPPLSPIMGAREDGFDEDRYLSRIHPSQILLLHPGLFYPAWKMPDKVRNGLVSPQAVVKAWPSCTMERSISLWR